MATKLKVGGMKCGGCQSAIKKALEAVDGVTEAEVALDPGSAVVKGTASAASLIAAVEATGKTASLIGSGAAAPAPIGEEGPPAPLSLGGHLVLLVNCACLFGWLVVGAVVAARLAGKKVGALLPLFPTVELGDGDTVWTSGALELGPQLELVGWNTVSALVVGLELLCCVEVLRMLVGARPPSRPCLPPHTVPATTSLTGVGFAQVPSAATWCWASPCTTPASSCACRSFHCCLTTLSPTPCCWHGPSPRSPATRSTSHPRRPPQPCATPARSLRSPLALVRVRRRSFRSETTSLAPHSLSPSPLACAGAEAYACYLALEMLASPEQQIVKVLAGTQVVVNTLGSLWAYPPMVSKAMKTIKGGGSAAKTTKAE
jgi:copper chaperone CopZ